jgi:hypothetical protein
MTGSTAACNALRACSVFVLWGISVGATLVVALAPAQGDHKGRPYHGPKRNTSARIGDADGDTASAGYTMGRLATTCFRSEGIQPCAW